MVIPPSSMIVVIGRFKLQPHRDALLQAVEPVLPFLHVGVGRPAMFGEVKCSTGTEDATDLADGGDRIGNRAQGPRGQRRVDRVVVEFEGLTIQTNELDGYVTSCQTLTGKIASSLQRVDRKEARDRWR